MALIKNSDFLLCACNINVFQHNFQIETASSPSRDAPGMASKVKSDFGFSVTKILITPGVNFKP